MKKNILILLSLSILLTSCFNKTEEKITLDKEDKKIIEQVLDVTNTGSEITEVKTEKEAIKKIENKETKKTETEIEEKTTSTKVEKVNTTKAEVKKEMKTEVIKQDIENVKEDTTLNEDEKESYNKLNELLGAEFFVDDAEEKVNKVK